MHKTLLCAISPCFNAALTGAFKEAKEQIIELGYIDVPVFKRFQLWAYTTRIVEANETPTAVDWSVLGGLYLFAEMKDIFDLQNAATDILIDKSYDMNLVPTQLCRRIWEETPDDSPIRRLLVDWVACRCDIVKNGKEELFMNARIDGLPNGFFVDLAFVHHALWKGLRQPVMDFKAARAGHHVKPSVAASTAPR